MPKGKKGLAGQRHEVLPAYPVQDQQTCPSGAKVASLGQTQGRCPAMGSEEGMIADAHSPLCPCQEKRIAQKARGC